MGNSICGQAFDDRPIDIKTEKKLFFPGSRNSDYNLTLKLIQKNIKDSSYIFIEGERNSGKTSALNYCLHQSKVVFSDSMRPNSFHHPVSFFNEIIRIFENEFKLSIDKNLREKTFGLLKKIPLEYIAVGSLGLKFKDPNNKNAIIDLNMNDFINSLSRYFENKEPYFIIVDDFQDFLESFNDDKKNSLSWLLEFFRSLYHRRIPIYFIFISSVTKSIEIPSRGFYFPKMIDSYKESDDLFGKKPVIFKNMSKEDIAKLIEHRAKITGIRLGKKKMLLINSLIFWLDKELTIIIKSLKESCENGKIIENQILKKGYEFRNDGLLWLHPYDIKEIVNKEIPKAIYKSLSLKPFGSQDKNKKPGQKNFKRANLILVIIHILSKNIKKIKLDRSFIEFYKLFLKSTESENSKKLTEIQKLLKLQQGYLINFIGQSIGKDDISKHLRFLADSNLLDPIIKGRTTTYQINQMGEYTSKILLDSWGVLFPHKVSIVENIKYLKLKY